MNEFLPEIEAALSSYLKHNSNGLNARVYEAMEYSILQGGKRIRPALTLYFCALCAGAIQNAMPFACAVEMIHTYSLIHDDLPCMDNDSMRRGRPSNHIAFGEDIALLAGDALLTMAFELMLNEKAQVNIGCEKAMRAASVMASCAGISGMIGGQCIDLQAEGKKIGLAELEAMDMGKTVALIQAACTMGVIVGGGNAQEILAAKEYAVGVGMAFQIRDDILDVIGTAETLGKNVGVDAQNAKCNYVSLLGIEKATALVLEYTEHALAALAQFEGDTKVLREFARALAYREK